MWNGRSADAQRREERCIWHLIIVVIIRCALCAPDATHRYKIHMCMCTCTWASARGIPFFKCSAGAPGEQRVVKGGVRSPPRIHTVFRRRRNWCWTVVSDDDDIIRLYVLRSRWERRLALSRLGERSQVSGEPWNADDASHSDQRADDASPTTTWGRRWWAALCISGSSARGMNWTRREQESGSDPGVDDAEISENTC